MGLYIVQYTRKSTVLLSRRLSPPESERESAREDPSDRRGAPPANGNVCMVCVDPVTVRV